MIEPQVEPVGLDMGAPVVNDDSESMAQEHVVDYDVHDTYDFHDEVDDAMDGEPDVVLDAEDVVDHSEDHMMTPIMDVLQTLGVSAADSANWAVNMTKSKSPSSVGFS